MTLVTSTRLALLLTLMPLAQAQILAPETLLFDDQVYDLVYSEDKQPSHIYEYTPRGQDPAAWDQMISLHYTPLSYVPGTTTENLLATQKKELAEERPQPSYTVHPLSDGYIVQVLYPPIDPDSPLKIAYSYESSVQRNFSIPTCGGIVSLHMAARRSPTAHQTQAEAMQQLQQLSQQNQALVLQENWQPVCK